MSWPLASERQKMDWFSPDGSKQMDLFRQRRKISRSARSCVCRKHFQMLWKAGK